MPIDTLKTTMVYNNKIIDLIMINIQSLVILYLINIIINIYIQQVDGMEGLTSLRNRLGEQEGLRLLYRGALAASAATFVGHFPWFLTYNYLSDNLPEVVDHVQLLEIARSAFIGLCASCAVLLLIIIIIIINIIVYFYKLLLSYYCRYYYSFY